MIPNFCFGQSNSQDEWLQRQKIEQYDFLKNFKTTEYICETRDSVRLKYNPNTKKVTSEKVSSFVGQKEIYKIIMSDDIKSRIGLCEPNDEPRSYDSKLNKYFCIVNTHPQEKPPNNTTHYKCLLDIDNSSDGKKSKIYTLVCNNKSFKFNLTFGVIFDNNFSIGPYSSYDNTLSQNMSISDCYKTSQ